MKNPIIAITSLIVLCSSCSASAGVWEERAILERYINQVKSLNQTLLNEAQLAADKDSRFRLNYDALKADSNEILEKVQHHIDEPLDTYRSADSLEKTAEGK